MELPTEEEIRKAISIFNEEIFNDYRLINYEIKFDRSKDYIAYFQVTDVRNEAYENRFAGLINFNPEKLGNKPGIRIAMTLFHECVHFYIYLKTNNSHLIGKEGTKEEIEIMKHEGEFADILKTYGITYDTEKQRFTSHNKYLHQGDLDYFDDGHAIVSEGDFCRIYDRLCKEANFPVI